MNSTPKILYERGYTDGESLHPIIESKMSLFFYHALCCLSVCVCAVCASGDPVLTVWSLWTLHVYVRTYVCTPVDTICTVHSVYTEVVTYMYTYIHIRTYVCMYCTYVHVCVFLAGIHLLLVVGIFGWQQIRATHTNLGKSTTTVNHWDSVVL